MKAAMVPQEIDKFLPIWRGSIACAAQGLKKILI